ncbi:NAD(P)H-binding protein [Jiangella alkaliphila]|uniref:dTDP-4-dehydrorhamnose reductase n=1 Tax=Jiangella alkaliphila TaxID=419479 RepID=A0A1H2LPX0_9ACTN|nr:NAD(P)H-binding protein [Jiangella alkaliphila]SDU82904.1 dTDP-4-dehydrorhamnose reductase [Jiangella alkaliphila]
MRIAVAGGTGRLGQHIVDVLKASGHDPVPLSRGTGVDVITGDGLAAALAGADVLVDAATGPSPDREQAAAFFRTSVANLRREAEQAGVRRVVVVSIIGVDRLTTGYGAAKFEQERAWQAGPIPVSVVRSDLFHEFVEPMMGWGRQGDVVHVARTVRRPVAARAAAETVARLATADEAPAMTEVAGPRVEKVVDLAALVAARNGSAVRIEGVSSPDADDVLYEAGAILPGPDAVLAGPSFADWLSGESR